MQDTIDILRGELERLFDLDDMMKLSAELLGIDPGRLGGEAGKAAFARALVAVCASDDALEALADAILLSSQKADGKIRGIYGARGAELKPGTEIAGYRVTKKLGEGNLGVSYLGERKAADGSTERAAIKVLNGGFCANRSAVRRFMTVQRALRGIDHPALARVIDVGELDDRRPWVATELVDGQTLAARVSRIGPMHYNEAKPIVRSVLAALGALHERGLVHGDVKAENVFIVRKTNPDGTRGEPTGMVVDAGADRLVSRGAVHLAKSLAPEVARGAGAGPSSDIYAVGVLIYEICSGKPPFAGKSAADVLAQNLSAEPQPPSAVAPRGWVGKDLDEIVLKALAKDPAERYRSAADLEKALEAVGRVAGARPSKMPLDQAAFDGAARSLSERPGDPDALATLEKIAEPAAAWPQAIEALRIAASGQIDIETKKALLFRVARIQEAELEDRKEAEGTYRSILDLDPEDEIATVGIEELKRAGGDAEGLVELLLEKVEKEEDSVERAGFLREIAQLYEEKLKQPESAFVAWVNALCDDPKDERPAREIERLATSPALWNEALETLSQAVQQPRDTSDQVHLYVLMGRWYSEVKRPDFALGCYGQALQLDPTSDEAYDGSIALFRKAQSWQELVQVLLQRAEASPNPARARDFRAEAATVILTRLNDADRAAAVFQEVLEADPAHPVAADSLQTIYADRGSWSSLAKLLETRAKNEGAEARVKTLVRAAELYEDRLDDMERALVHYESALAHDGRNVDALKGLDRIYARTGRFQELLDVLEKQLDTAATPRQKIGALERIGGILEEEFRDAARAAHAFERIIEIEPGHDAANTALERLYRQLNRFDDLVETVDRHAKLADDKQRKVELLLKAVRTLMQDVGAPSRATSYCERVLAIDPQNADALEAMAHVQSSAGDVASALASMERLAEGEKEPKKRADLWYQAGKLLQDGSDNDGAIARYKKSLDANIHHTRASAALRAIYEGRGDVHSAAELLRREIDATDGAITKAKLWGEIGTLWRRRLDKPEEAKDAFVKSLELDPTNVYAAGGLGGMAFDEGDWDTSVRYYEPLLARVNELPPGIAPVVAKRCGDAFRKLGNLEKAQRCYLNAKSFAPDDREILERVAEVTYEAGPPDEAAEVYREMIAKLRGELVGHERGRLLYLQGEATRRAGRPDEAIKLLTEAAELRPEDGAPIESLRAIYEAKGEWDAVVRTLKRRMDHADDGERFRLMVDVGDIMLQKLGDREKAAKSYVSALEIRADDRNLLTKLMGVYSETKDWSRLVEVILRIAELVDNPKQLGKYYVTAASICHEELGRLDEAADYYEQAAENDPSLVKAFDGLVRCLTRKADWDRLVGAYRTQIDRVKATATPEQRAALWDAMGEILHHRLDREGDAVEALEEAQRVDSQNRRRLEQLAEIYTTEPDRYFAKAVDVHRQLLGLSPYRIESYQSLRRLFTDVKKADESWCLCQTLRVLKAAGPEEEAFFKKHRSRNPAEAQEFFTEEIWFSHITHADQDPLLTGIFATITPAVVAKRSQTLKSYGVDESKRRDPENDPAVMAQTLHYVAGVTQITLPPVYYRENDPGGLSIMFTSPPAIGLGKGALAGGPNQALAFVAGRHLAYFRQGFYLRHLVPTGSGLRAWLLAAIKTATPQFPIPADLKAQVAEHQGAIKEHLGPREIDQLQSLVGKLLAAAPELDMKRWVAAVDLTADRVGFVLANDLEISAAVVKASPEDAAAVPQKDRLRDLYLYSVSDEYLALRHKLGIAIGE